MHRFRPSRILRRLRAGEPACCVKINSSDAQIVEIAAMCSVDSVWVCQEHVPSSIESVTHQVRAAKLHDVDVIVRVSRGSYSDLIRPLEADAAAIMVPHVTTGEEARQIVRQTRFHPVGRRPLDGGGADGGYCHIPLAEYVAQANEQRMVIVQIEDPEAMNQLDDIASVEGIDMLFFGPGDFSHGLGVTGRFDDPRLQEARRRVASTARRYGKWAGTTGALADIPQHLDEGYHLLNIGSDVAALTQVFSRVAAAFDRSPDQARGIYSGV